MKAWHEMTAEEQSVEIVKQLSEIKPRFYVGGNTTTGYATELTAPNVISSEEEEQKRFRKYSREKILKEGCNENK